MLIYISVFLKM